MSKAFRYRCRDRRSDSAISRRRAHAGRTRRQRRPEALIRQRLDRLLKHVHESRFTKAGWRDRNRAAHNVSLNSNSI